MYTKQQEVMTDVFISQYQNVYQGAKVNKNETAGAYIMQATDVAYTKS
jgi:hypothetical protein